MTREYFYRRHFAEGITRSFVQIRRIHRLDDLPTAGPPPARSWRQRSLRLLRRLAMLLPFHHPLLRLERKGLRDGFRRHQKRFRDDARLRAWVLRTDWLHDAPDALQP
jgi:hypothetical protein